VISGLTTKVVSQGGETLGGKFASEEIDLMLGASKDQAKKTDASLGLSSRSNQIQAATGAEKLISADDVEPMAFKGPSSKRQAVKSDVAGPDAGKKTDGPSSLPTAMLQRIAGAVLAEAQQMSAQLKMRGLEIDGPQVLTSAKASEGAVRLLNIQLHPADLGLITVRMRLSGDGLETEIEVTKEETAQLLKNDAEKLSGLLRGSGFRPDLLTIHTGQTGSAGPDEPPRQQSTSQSQREAFQPGAQHHERGSQPSEQKYEHNRKGGRNDASDEAVPNKRSAGGIYL
jgi:flagellar hook-length control protein FliK